MKRSAKLLLMALGACCTKMECPAEEVALTFQLENQDQFTSNELQSFFLVTTDKYITMMM